VKVLIHDLKEDDFNELFPSVRNDVVVISNNAPIHNCIGCFGCWIKTPAACVIRDKYGDMGELMSKCEEMHIISECYYGGLSPFTKNVFDRSISYIHPFFVLRKGEMHHRPRYKKRINLKIWFYGSDITNNEKETAKKLVAANALNINAVESSVSFCNNLQDMEDRSL